MKVERALNQGSGPINNGETGNIIEESKSRIMQIEPVYPRRWQQKSLYGFWYLHLKMLVILLVFVAGFHTVCSPGRPDQTPDPPASASQILGLQTRATTPCLVLCVSTFGKRLLQISCRVPLKSRSQSCGWTTHKKPYVNWAIKTDILATATCSVLNWDANI